MPRSPSVRPSISSVYPETVQRPIEASLIPPQMQNREDINKQIRASLGLPPVPEAKPTVAVEGHVCEFPLWSFSKKRNVVTRLHIDYEDGSFMTLVAPLGMPSTRFPGYLDVILFYGQRDLFLREYVEISVYQILKTLDIDATNGGAYAHFHADMEKAFAAFLKTDRFRNPKTGERDYVSYFRVLRNMDLAKRRQGISRFYFDERFLASLRAGYLKRLDWEYCLELGRQSEALVRFLYGHLLKRLGEKSIYMRSLSGFLSDVGLGYLEPKRQTETLKRTVYPALDAVKGIQYYFDDQGNLVFIPKD